ncbi:MAG: DegT/DnrJ/EryC1/StrS family aminotransferase [Dongiaceae bacterium]
MSAPPPRIPVGRPLLPGAAAIRPYLDEIDANRWYSNYGPLARRLQDRLTATVRWPGGEPGAVVSCANATLGLTLALMAQEPAPGSLCLMPAWTFVASPLAARMAGLVPWFADVAAEDWAISPAIAERAIAAAPGPVGAVMPVAPFGRPPDTAAWDDFAAASGLPVVIDAAAGFDGIAAGRCPVVVSLHATKALGIGEGGFVAATDRALLKAIAQRANFGFWGNRETALPATNAKMSEYHAAVGLAALDGWPERRAAFAAVAAGYRRALAGSGVRLPDGLGEAWVASTMVVGYDGPPPAALAARLAEAGIETRAWWGEGCHRAALFADAPRTDLPVTEALARSTIGLPCHADLAAADIAAVAEALGQALAEPAAEPAAERRRARG